MDRIEACADLHLFDFVYCFSVGIDDPCLFPLRSAIKELVFNDQVLGLFRIDEAGHVMVRIQVFKIFDSIVL